MLQFSFGLVNEPRQLQLEAFCQIVDLLSADTSLQSAFALCDPMHGIYFEVFNDTSDLCIVFLEVSLIFTNVHLQVSKLLSNDFAGPILIVLHRLIVFVPFDAHFTLAFQLM